jgi:hypothetical protein
MRLRPSIFKKIGIERTNRIECLLSNGVLPLQRGQRQIGGALGVGGVLVAVSPRAVVVFKTGPEHSRSECVRQFGRSWLLRSRRASGAVEEQGACQAAID